jgi:hypothetical protein
LEKQKENVMEASCLLFSTVLDWKRNPPRRDDIQARGSHCFQLLMQTSVIILSALRLRRLFDCKLIPDKIQRHHRALQKPGADRGLFVIGKNDLDIPPLTVPKHAAGA